MSTGNYAAVWDDGGGQALAGTVALGAIGLQLDGSASGRLARLRIPYANIRALNLGRRNGERVAGRPALILRFRRAQVRIAVPEPGALYELAETIAERTNGRRKVMKRIVIATDGSCDATRAIHEGLELARDLDAEVTFVSVRTPPNAVWGAPVYQAELETATQIAREAIDKAIALAEEAGMEADYEILDGPAAEAINAVADTRDADFIVVGSRGRGAVKGALFGSVSKALVTHSHRAVLVVKEPAHQAALA